LYIFAVWFGLDFFLHSAVWIGSWLEMLSLVALTFNRSRATCSMYGLSASYNFSNTKWNNVPSFNHGLQQVCSEYLSCYSFHLTFIHSIFRIPL
jgi:hypothetical protein